MEVKARTCPFAGGRPALPKTRREEEWHEERGRTHCGRTAARPAVQGTRGLRAVRAGHPGSSGVRGRRAFVELPAVLGSCRRRREGPLRSGDQARRSREECEREQRGP